MILQLTFYDEVDFNCCGRYIYALKIFKAAITIKSQNLC